MMFQVNPISMSLISLFYLYCCCYTLSNLLVSSINAVQKSGYADFEEAHTGDSMSCNYGTTLPEDPNCSVVCSWATADPSTFLIRGESYLHDHQKVSVRFYMFIYRS